ncbi:M48 family metallopeptidase [Bdellovibrio sp. KM01]|uniref:M48 family metallopeptidase n=1 Tax=Bdellovibrio sp. KM01 TaxID=2748865 RepID=UPI0015E983E3|nr:M48 family metallopeptidase [Bdellovibrio sp. KM01]QLY26587.1 M48 family metallopeptidase [Bdellovibrio sp. KM01]
MRSYRAKYFDGETPSSQEVLVKINEAVLEISKDGRLLDTWPLKLLHRDPVYISVIVVLCQGEPDARLEILEKDFLQEPLLKVKFQKEQPLQFKKSQIALWLSALVVAVGVVFLAVKPVTKMIARNISHAREKQMLGAIMQLRPPTMCQLSVSQGIAFEKLLSKVYPIQEGDKELGIEFHVIKNAQVNAFALPGAQIWILSGLLEKAQSPEEIVGVLAHEIEHVKQRHILESIVRSTLLTSLMAISVGDASAVLVVDPHTASQFFTLSFDREMEASADKGALNRMRQSKVSTQGIIDLFKRLDETGPASKIPEFISTHPAGKARIEMFEPYSIAADNQPILTKEEWRDLKRACQ